MKNSYVISTINLLSPLINNILLLLGSGLLYTVTNTWGSIGEMNG